MPSNKTILIASVLKPVDDVRHFRKIARSLASANKYQIFIIGKGLTKNSEASNIQFLPSGQFSRISLGRLWVQIRFLKAAIRLRPDLILITTPELLFVTWLIRKYRKVKVIYDVQENYNQNFRFQNEYHFVHRLLFRSIYRVMSTFRSTVDHYLLAEKIYETELDLPSGKYSVFENRTLAGDILRREPRKFGRNTPIRLVVSGNHSPYSNTLAAIKFFKKFRVRYPDSSLTIIGKVIDDQYHRTLLEECAGTSSIILRIQKTELAHKQIIDEIHRADLAIIPYLPDKVNSHKIPTKLFEYSSNRMPYFVQENTQWATLSVSFGGGIPVDFAKPDLDFIEEKLTNYESLFSDNSSSPPLWEGYEADLFRIIDSLI